MERVGTALAAAGACCYGVTVVVGRNLAEHGMPAGTALGFRFGVAAVALGVLLRMRGVALVPGRRELIGLLLLGGIGYTTESTFFYSALQRGTAAAVTLLFYAYPAIVFVVELARGREKPERSTVLALLLAVGGTSVVVSTGARVSISAGGIAFALSSATVFAFYMIVSREVMRRSEAMRAAAWVAAGASAGSFLRGSLGGEIRSPDGYVVQLVLYGVFTAGAFTLIFLALERIGAARTAVVMTLEAVTAVVLGSIVLGEGVHWPQLVGGAAILVAAATIGRREGVPAELRD